MILLLSLLCVLGAGAAPRVGIPAGNFRPQFGSENLDLAVSPFWIDRSAVTNSDFDRFLKASPDWRRGRAGPEVADANYLARGPRTSRAPVVNVSWFAAVAFCESRGGRLPSTLEWEYVAAASKVKKDASRDPGFGDQILQWYSARASRPGPADAGETNFYGVRGLHGLVWEWTSDFNAFFVSADNRQDGDQSKNFFCGSASTGAADREGYAAFMRYALRSSLHANYSLNSLGFRCAYDHG